MRPLAPLAPPWMVSFHGSKPSSRCFLRGNTGLREDAQSARDTQSDVAGLGSTSRAHARARSPHCGPKGSGTTQLTRRGLPMGFTFGVLVHLMRSSCGSGLQAPALLEPAV